MLSASDMASPQFVEETIGKYRQYVNPGLANLMDFCGYHGVEWSGHGMVVRDTTGAEYLDFLGGYGWRVVEHLGYEELAERYVKTTGRELASTPIERMVYAEKV